MNYKQVKRVVLTAAAKMEENPGHTPDLQHKVNNLLLAVEADVAPIDEISDDASASKEIEILTQELEEYNKTLKM